jgi:hypothetical protein
VKFFRVAFAAAAAAAVVFPQELLPLSAVRPGQKGVGRTVFQGAAPEDFQVEILGVLENVGPRQNIILARLSGGPLEKTGVLQGMSGSPVYIDGKLIGAVALAFPYSKETIAGIRPIEEMLAVEPQATAAPRARLPAPGFGEARLTEVATPVSFSGFTSRTVEHFAPEWRKLGLEPLQGVGGRAATATGRGAGPALEPGSMISVQLVTGDLSVAADGTVTMIRGDRIYAFGHRMLGVGAADMPFARSEVIALLPNLASSFKISASYETLGTITQDSNAAVAGELRRRASLIPVKIRVQGAARQSEYAMEMVQGSILTPFLLQMALFSAIDGTERTLGSATISVSGQVRFEGDLPAMEIGHTLAGDFNAPVAASVASAAPLATLLQTALDPVRVAGIDLHVKAFEARNLWQIAHVSASRKKARPGDTVRISVVLTGPGDIDRIEHVDYVVPVGAPAGPLTVTVSDALTANLAENRLFGAAGRAARQIIAQANSLRHNSSAWLRVTRPEPSVQVAGADYSNLPAAYALLLGRDQPQITLAGTTGSRVFDAEIPLGDGVVAGQKSVSFEVVR